MARPARLAVEVAAYPDAGPAPPPDEEICGRAQEVADACLAPRAGDYDRCAELPLDNLRDLGRCGLMGLLVPPRYGGLGGTVAQFAQASEILARACPSTSMIWGMHSSQVLTLVEHGDERQKSAFLPGIAAGRILVASATTEPGTGGNFYYCNSAARREADGWSITATKPVVTGARHADLCFVITRSDPEAPGDRLSLFMVPCGADGVRRVGEWDTVGMRATQSTGLELRDVRVGDLHLLGAEGGFGPMALTSMLPAGLCGFAATWLGAAQAALSLAIEHVRQRVHRFSMPGDEDGHAVARYEVVQRQIGEAGTLLAQTRAFVLQVAGRIDGSKPRPDAPVPLGRALPIVEEAMALRTAAGENALEVTTTALRIAGAQAYRRDHLGIERFHRDVLSAQVMAPAPDMIKTVLGRLALGLSFSEAIRFH